MNANVSHETQATCDHATLPDSPVSTRRRGTALVDAIHAAVLAELSEGSMAGLTMERVAERARTGKAALYRRWASREELIIDTLSRRLPVPPRIANGASVRDQLLDLMGEMAATLSGPEGALARHIFAVLHTNEAMRAALTERLVQPRLAVLMSVLAAGVERGEVRPEAVTALIAQVGPSMLIYRFFVSGAVSFADSVAVVDQVLMPLVRAVPPVRV